MGVGFFEKFDYLSMKEHHINKSQYIDKCRSKLVKQFGLYWFQKMSDEEWKEFAPNLVELRQDVKGMD